MVSPPKSDGENGVLMPPPLPPMPAGLDFYEKVDNQAGPCLREFGKPWVPVSCRPGYQNEWSIFPGDKTSEKEMFLRHALEEWDRRQFRPDGSWRKDWNPPPPPPVGAFGHPEECHDGRAFNSNELGGRLQRFEECQDGRAFNSTELGGRLQRFGECHDGRAFSSNEFGGHRQRFGVCHEGRALTGTVLGDGRHHPGVCQDSRALSGTVLGVHQPLPCECPDHRAFGMSYHGDHPGHQQPQRHGLCDPTVEGGGSKGHVNRPLEKQGDVKSPRERSPQDALRSTNPTVPPLPAVNKRHASIEAADWLEEMKPVIGDISNRASKWWEMTMSRTWEVYHVWLQSNPLQRIRIHPPDPVPWQELGNEQVIKRLEQRVTTILLPALPSEMRNDLITSRQLWPCAILYKILRCYQPGGWAKRSSLLTDLTATKAMKDAASAASALRLWHRQKQRAIELGASVPDALLQVRALEMIVSQVIVKQPQALFRISTFRMEAGLDEKPTDTSIAQFLELLTAEMDAIALGTTSVDTSSVPSAKALQLDLDGKRQQEFGNSFQTMPFLGK